MKCSGSGDPSQAFQSFKLKKSPLTWLDDPTGFNGRRSTLSVRVNGILWTEVPSFYGTGAQDEVYIIRQNEDNASIVTFGDGTTGARLPRGVGNVTATYRYGAGAAKPPANSITQIARAVSGLRQVVNPVAAGGGSDADSAEDLRTNAPTSSLLLGRAVSLADFEALAREFGGVINASATWAWDGRMQRAVVKIWFISDGGAIADDLRSYLLGQSDPNVPLEAEEAEAVEKPLVVDLAVDSSYNSDDVEQAVIDALMDNKSGLLALENIPDWLSAYSAAGCSRKFTMFPVSFPFALCASMARRRRRHDCRGGAVSRFFQSTGRGKHGQRRRSLPLIFRIWQHPPATGNPAQDGFERYYAEKIWEWIPSTYRHEDGLANPPYVLRGIVEILARQAANARRTSDRLWEDQFIQTCDDWAVPYIGNLLGTRLVGSPNRRGRRADVARTIFYRRRKGTPVVMEALIQDITGWEGAVVESFKRLARARHRLDPEPARLAGPITGTPPGGTANLREGRIDGILDGPFDDMAHTPDFRRIEGYQGRYNIPKLNFFLYRLFAYEVVKATPWDFGGERFTFDPSGRDIALFRHSQRFGNTAWTPVQEWQLPAPIPCRLLDEFASELIPDDVDLAVAQLTKTPIRLPHTAIQAGNLEDWSLPATAGIEAFIDPVLGRFLLTSAPAGDDEVYALRYHYGFSGEVGAGTYNRSQSVLQESVTDFDGGLNQPGPVTGFSLPSTGAHQFTNSKTYRPDAPANNTVDAIEELVLQAADRERPYITLVPGADATEWIFKAAPKGSGRKTFAR